MRVRQCFVQLQQLTLALCLVARFTLYLHYFIAFSQASNVVGLIIHNSQMRRALCLVIQLVLTVQLTSVRHISRQHEKVMNMAASGEV